MHKPSFAVEQSAFAAACPVEMMLAAALCDGTGLAECIQTKPLSVGSCKLQGRAVFACSTMRQQNANTWRTKQTLVAVMHNVVCSAN